MLGYIQKIRIKNKKVTYNLKDAVLRLSGPSVVVVVAVFVVLDPERTKLKKKNIPMGQTTRQMRRLAHPNPGIVVDGGGEVVVTWRGGGGDVVPTFYPKGLETRPRLES